MEMLHRAEGLQVGFSWNIQSNGNELLSYSGKLWKVQLIPMEHLLM